MMHGQPDILKKNNGPFDISVWKVNPLNAELNPICYLLAFLELTIFSTLAR